MLDLGIKRKLSNNILDYIIVGQGIAGSVLAYTLLKEGQKVLVIDEDKPITSSKVAAGLCNPIVFKRLTKSWMVDEILPFAKKFYQNQEKTLQQQFYFDLPLYKIFTNEKEQQFWQQKSNDPQVFDWINNKIEYPFDKEKVICPYGAAKTIGSGVLKTTNWLTSFKNYLITQKAYLNRTFDYTKIEFTPNGVYWNEYHAKKLIFCEGYQCIHNPFFSWLPFKLTKGEVLTVSFEKLELKQAINKGVFIIPYGENYKLGATYNWDQLDNHVTATAKAFLLQKANQFINDKIKVVDHQAGIRPTVNDRRPLIGTHPLHNQLAIFNGLGTKGVMLAPYLAKKMTDFLLNDNKLPSEVDISRCS